MDLPLEEERSRLLFLGRPAAAFEEALSAFSRVDRRYRSAVANELMYQVSFGTAELTRERDAALVSLREAEDALRRTISVFLQAALLGHDAA